MRRRRAKVSTQVSKYSASGTTHSSGIAARSVVKNVVTPSRRLDGIAPRNSQRNWRRAGIVGGGVASATGAATAASAEAELAIRPTVTHAVAAMSVTSPAYATVHATACSRVPSIGSASSG